MKKRIFDSIYVMAIIFLPLQIIAQDARIYYESINYTGPVYKDLKLGQTVYVNSDGDAMSIRIFNPNVAIKATNVDEYFRPFRPGSNADFFVYTEKDMPKIAGTDQYQDRNLRVECIPKAETWQQLPQPQIYLPFNMRDTNPNPDNDANIIKYVATHNMLVLRRAYLWENSEALGGFHGPYGDVKIEAWDPYILQFSETELLNKWNMLESKYLLKSKSSELPGPIWSGYSGAGVPGKEYPDPYDEWVDGPFGCIYSNIAVYDWGAKGAKSSIAVAITESDAPNMFMGKSDYAITPETTGEILIKVWGYGFVVLENFKVPDSGSEPSVSRGNVYWYAGWDGNYPFEVYGPQNAVVSCETCPGNQFRPFTNEQFYNFENNRNFYGYQVGLVGTKYPPGVYNKPYTFHAIDQPATLGALKGIEVFNKPNYKGDSRFFTSDVSNMDATNIQFDDQTESVKIYNLKEVRLYNLRGYDASGGYITITSNTPDLGTQWNHLVGSLKIIR